MQESPKPLIGHGTELSIGKVLYIGGIDDGVTRVVVDLTQVRLVDHTFLARVEA